MLFIVTSYLLQARCCILPGIGEFVLTTKPAVPDISVQRINPPVDEVVFTENEDARVSPALVKYIASRKGENEETAELILNNYCEEWKKSISLGESIELPSLGTLEKNDDGTLFFRKAAPETIYRFPVVAERVIHENANHPILVGDKETFSSEMTDYYAESEPVKKKKIMACLGRFSFFAATVLLVLHFNENGFSSKAIGNKSGILVDSFSVDKVSTELK